MLILHLFCHCFNQLKSEVISKRVVSTATFAAILTTTSAPSATITLT
ncbi:MAG: hypothetical protein ACLTC1_10080 [Turicibacter sp.]